MNEWWVNLGQLDDDQKRVMGLPRDGDFLVLGPPGSGKTNLLLLRANYLTKAGLPNVLIVVFGRTLREFLSRGGSRYNFQSDRITTSTRWYYDVLHQLGEPMPQLKGRRFDEMRTELIERVRAAVESKSSGPLYDVVLLDEAQDFLPEEIDLFSMLSGHMFAVGDSNQKIYAGESPLDVLRKRCDEYRLSHHYRNGLKICRFADSVGATFRGYAPMVGTSNYSETRQRSSVELVASGTLEEQVSLIVDALKRQRRAFSEGEMFGVLCPRREDVEAVHAELLKTSIRDSVVKQTFADGYVPFGDDETVCVTTIHGAKGLEFRAVHAPAIENVRCFPRQRNLVFTLATRAKTSLSLYTLGSPPGFVESAMLAVEPPSTIPPLDAAFGG